MLQQALGSRCFASTNNQWFRFWHFYTPNLYYLDSMFLWYHEISLLTIRKSLGIEINNTQTIQIPQLQKISHPSFSCFEIRLKIFLAKHNAIFLTGYILSSQQTFVYVLLLHIKISVEVFWSLNIHCVIYILSREIKINFKKIMAPKCDLPCAAYCGHYLWVARTLLSTLWHCFMPAMATKALTK